MRALFDANVLIALLDSAHVHHGRARDWLIENIESGWASCPITQNGTVRILSQPSYPGSQPPAAAAERLRQATATEWHEFWPDELSLVEAGVLEWGQVLGSRQLTDAYLLALAVRNGGRFVTLDRSVPVAAVPGASERHLLVL